MPKKLPKTSKDIAKLTSKVKQYQSTLIPLKKDFLVKELQTSLPYESQATYRIGHWNVNGIRAVIKKDTFLDYINDRNFDILCLNETKIDKNKLQQALIPDHSLWKLKYNQYWNFSTAKLGYSGVTILTKPKPISYEFGIGQSTFDLEGRTITVEYPDFYLIAVYVPNAGPGCARLKEKISVWETAFQDHIDKLRAKKNVMIIGDLNVAHKPIDLHDPKANEDVAGYSIEERNAFSALLDKGYKDTYRELNPEKNQYTYFSAIHKQARPQKKGWRIDYCIVNEEIIDRIEDSIIRDDIFGSDHVPIEVVWRTSSPTPNNIEVEKTSDEKEAEKQLSNDEKEKNKSFIINDEMPLNNRVIIEEQSD